MMWNERAGEKSGRWWPTAAGGAAIAAALAFGGFGFSPLPAAAEDGKKAEEKKPTADGVQTGPPAELQTLRRAIEEAAKKGENVDDIRKQMDALERAMTGRTWKKPAPATGEPDALPKFRVRPDAPDAPAFPFPNVGPNVDAVRAAQQAIADAMQDMRKNPQDRAALQRAIEEQRKIMMQALGQFGGIALGGPNGLFQPDPFAGRGAARNGEGRLGVGLEKLSVVVADQLDLPAGRGLSVRAVVPGSAAEKAGFKENDIILEFAGGNVTDDAADLVRRVQEVKAGEKVDATVLRKGKKETIKGIALPEVGRRADAGDAPRDGLRRDGPRPFGGRNSTVRISLNDGRFDIRATEGGTEYTVKGKVEDGKPVASEVTVVEGDKTAVAESIEEVPAEYREKVQSLLGRMSGAGNRLPQPRD